MAEGNRPSQFNLNIKDGQADLQLCFQLGRPGDHHLPPSPPRTRAKGPKQKQRDNARAAAHHARLAAAATAPVTRENVTLVAEPGNPVLTAPETVTPPPSASGRGGTAALDKSNHFFF